MAEIAVLDIRAILICHSDKRSVMAGSYSLKKTKKSEVIICHRHDSLGKGV